MTRSRPTFNALFLLALACALAGAPGCRREPRTLPSDEELIAFFREHRADLDSLRETDQAQLRFGPNDRDPVLTQRWTRLIRRLGLPGGGALELTTRIFIPVAGRPLGRELIDVKGFAWVDSIQPRGARLDTLTNLDTLDPRMLATPGRHLRHLDGAWWLFRWVDRPVRD